jgi:SET domain-containing protein
VIFLTVTGLLSSNEYKKRLSRCYNEVHRELYGVGVTQLRIDAAGESMILFLVKHQRVTALRALEENYPELKQSVDAALHHEFKRKFQKKLTEELNLPVTGVLRDYDPGTGWASTIIISE